MLLISSSADNCKALLDFPNFNSSAKYEKNLSKVKKWILKDGLVSLNSSFSSCLKSIGIFLFFSHQSSLVSLHTNMMLVFFSFAIAIISFHTNKSPYFASPTFAESRNPGGIKLSYRICPSCNISSFFENVIFPPILLWLYNRSINSFTLSFSKKSIFSCISSWWLFSKFVIMFWISESYTFHNIFYH